MAGSDSRAGSSITFAYMFAALPWAGKLLKMQAKNYKTFFYSNSENDLKCYKSKSYKYMCRKYQKNIIKIYNNEKI